MKGKIDSGQLCTVAPIERSDLTVGDFVLCKVNGRENLHLVKAIKGERFQVGNNRGLINGWVSGHSIFGRCVRVEPKLIQGEPTLEPAGMNQAEQSSEKFHQAVR